MKILEKLQGRQKVVWLEVSNKVNELIDILYEFDERLDKLEKKIGEDGEK